MAVGDPKPGMAWHEGSDSDTAHRREVRQRFQDMVTKGSVQWVNEFTLATGATSTTVNDPRVTTDSQISLMPLTPEAAALQGKVYIAAAGLTPGTESSSSRVGQFVVTHPNLLAGVVATFRSSCKG